MHKKKENLMQNKLGKENGLVKLRLIIAFLSVINEPHLIIYLNKYFHKNYLHLKKPTRTNIVCDDYIQSSKIVNI